MTTKKPHTCVRIKAKEARARRIDQNLEDETEIQIEEKIRSEEAAKEVQVRKEKADKSELLHAAQKGQQTKREENVPEERVRQESKTKRFARSSSEANAQVETLAISTIPNLAYTSQKENAI